MLSKRTVVPILEYAVHRQDDGWQVLLGAQVLSTHSLYAQAYRAVEAEAVRAARLGSRSRIVVGPVDGVRIEFPIMEPEQQPARPA